MPYGTLPLLSSPRRRQKREATNATAALESRQLLSGYTQPDVFEIDGFTGNFVNVSTNDSNMGNYQLVSQGQYATMIVNPSGQVIISANEIPDGFTDILQYKAQWSEWVGSYYDGPYHEEVHEQIETVAVKEKANPWSIEDFTTLTENTAFTVHGTGRPGAVATLHLYQKISTGSGWSELPDAVTVGVDADGQWQVSGTTPNVNTLREYKYVLIYGSRDKDKLNEYFEVSQ